MPEGKYFVIRSKLNDLCLDIEAGGSEPGTKVITFGHHGGDNQLWYLDHRTGTIRSKLNNMCLDLNDNRLVINPLSPGDTSQQWELKGDHVCNRMEENKVFDIVGNNSDSGAEVCGWDNHGGDNQRWKFEHVAPTYFYIVSRMNDKVMDIKGGDPAPGTSIIMWEKKDSPEDNQLWYEDGNGVIRSKLNDMAMDGTDGLVTAPHNPGEHRQWWIIDGDKILNRYNTDEALDIARASHSDGADVIPYNYHGGENQQWRFDYI